MAFYRETRSKERIARVDISDSFKIAVGVRQGSVHCSLLFNFIFYIRGYKARCGGGLRELLYEDDFVVTACRADGGRKIYVWEEETCVGNDRIECKYGEDKDDNW